MDLERYIPADPRGWIGEAAEEMGWDELTRYYDRVLLKLWDMKPGDDLRVTDVVRPENYALFLKCAATAICELESMDVRTYYIEERGTLIQRR